MVVVWARCNKVRSSSSGLFLCLPFPVSCCCLRPKAKDLGYTWAVVSLRPKVNLSFYNLLLQTCGPVSVLFLDFSFDLCFISSNYPVTHHFSLSLTSPSPSLSIPPPSLPLLLPPLSTYLSLYISVYYCRPRSQYRSCLEWSRLFLLPLKITHKIIFIGLGHGLFLLFLYLFSLIMDQIW